MGPLVPYFTTTKTFLQLLGKDHLQKALSSAQPPVFGDLDEIHKHGFPNVVTLWYAYKLINDVPAIFPATQALRGPYYGSLRTELNELRAKPGLSPSDLGDVSDDSEQERHMERVKAFAEKNGQKRRADHEKKDKGDS
ncbi:hypothetical protein PENSUB_8281 [Penicillium subrubescens]|uniref:Uncharacterized protein n=1 Tax=Penicillium subrubescens TaxID=1316194 RepID=A0A1Q5THB1_9EURO|nr:hypothetical protein PENSUB_8281 [Penicillium subrubescens]